MALAAGTNQECPSIARRELGIWVLGCLSALRVRLRKHSSRYNRDPKAEAKADSVCQPDEALIYGAQFIFLVHCYVTCFV
jgi:hypothetical protein